MKVSASKVTNVILSLTESEAEWLMGFVQNYPHADTPEGSVEAALRAELYNSLRKELYPSNTPKEIAK